MLLASAFKLGTLQSLKQVGEEGKEGEQLRGGG